MSIIVCSLCALMLMMADTKESLTISSLLKRIVGSHRLFIKWLVAESEAQL